MDERRAAFGMARHFVNIRGYGPMKLRHKLREKGLASELIDEAIEALEVDWKQLATQLAERKGNKSKEQLARFLASRGFPSSIAWGVSASVSASRASSSRPEEDPSSDEPEGPA